MPSTLDSKSGSHEVIEIAPDIVLVARAAAEFPSLAPDHRSSDRQPNRSSGFADGPVSPEVDTSFRATDTSGGRSHGVWARKFVVTFTFAVCSALAVAAWQHYRDDAEEMVAGIAPQILPTLTSWLPMEKPTSTAQPDAVPATETAAVTQTTPPPAPAPARPTDNTTAAAAPPDSSEMADQAQLLQAMTRDVANLTQQVDELKATVAQLKASQEQFSREKVRPAEARTSEPKPVQPHPTRLGAPPRPLGTLVQRARPPAYPPPQAAYVPTPSPPVQIAPPPTATAQPDGDPVVRPPMPVR